MATRKVYPTSYVLENADDKDETNERSASRVGKSLDEDESDEEAAGIATRAHRKRVEAGLKTASAKEFFLKRLVIALIILVILLGSCRGILGDSSRKIQMQRIGTRNRD